MQRIGYVRISRPEKQDPASQLHLMQDLGIGLTDIYIDSTSGSIPPLKRPQYRRMIDRLDQGDVDELVVSEFSRIGRSVVESLMEVLAIQKRNIKITSLAERENQLNIFPVDMQPVMISMMMYSASLERQHIKERTKWGMSNARVNGTRSGKPIGRPVVPIDFHAVRKLMADKNLKEAQAIRVLGYKPRTYYAKKKASDRINSDTPRA
jgi:putative DNA-invertase from lambdoid prophage Rac